MIDLLKAISPILFLLGLWVGGVYLVKFIIRRLLGVK